MGFQHTLRFLLIGLMKFHVQGMTLKVGEVTESGSTVVKIERFKTGTAVWYGDSQSNTTIKNPELANPLVKRDWPKQYTFVMAKTVHHGIFARTF
jgi:hypothetical protein